MKTVINLFTLLCLLLASCENDDEPANATEKCFLVVNVKDLCGQAILQIMESEHHDLGENWNGMEHVFLAAFVCEEIPTPNTAFYVKLLNADVSQKCDRCDALLTSDPPGKKYIVHVVDDCPQPTF